MTSLWPLSQLWLSLGGQFSVHLTSQISPGPTLQASQTQRSPDYAHSTSGSLGSDLKIAGGSMQPESFLCGNLCPSAGWTATFSRSRAFPLMTTCFTLLKGPPPPPVKPGMHLAELIHQFRNIFTGSYLWSGYCAAFKLAVPALERWAGLRLKMQTEESRNGLDPPIPSQAWELIQAHHGRQSLAQPGGGVGRDFEAQADQPPIQVLMSSSRREAG